MWNIDDANWKLNYVLDDKLSNVDICIDNKQSNDSVTSTRNQLHEPSPIIVPQANKI